MTVNDLLKHPILDLPKNWKNEGAESYYLYIVRTGKQYIDLLRELDDFKIQGNDSYMGQIPYNEFIYSVAENLYQTIIHSVRIYLNEGNPHNAYKTFENYFVKMNDRLGSPDSYLSRSLLKETEVLYRLRQEKEYPLKRANELFHVPFECRHKIGTMRYSVPGYPCLYASNSVYLAHKEINEIPFDKNLYVSKLKVDNSKYGPVYLVDLRNHVEEMRKTHIDNPNFYEGNLLKFFCTWLLTMACSVTSVYVNSPYKEEYILPQLLMQWIKNTKFSKGINMYGVMFSSSKISISNQNNKGVFYNIAVPVHHAKTHGLCDIMTKRFKMSDPITIEDLKGDKKCINSVISMIEIEGNAVQYSETIYCDFEGALDTNEFRIIK